MKLSFGKVTYLLLLGILPFRSNAQVIHDGADARNQFNNAEIVRESQFSELPSFIKFREAEQFDIDQLKNWMSSNIKFAPNIGFELIRMETDNLGHVHYRFQQTLNDKPIEDAIWIAHTKNDKVYSLNGLIYKKLETLTAVSISETTALETALEHINATTYKWQLPNEEAHLKWETGNPDATYFPEGELTFVSSNYSFNEKDYRIAYKFNVYAHSPVSRAHIYVDANSGDILRENKIICHADEEGEAETVYSGTKDIIADSFEGQYRLRDASRGDGVRTFDLNQGTSYFGSVDFLDDDNLWDNVNAELDEYATDAHWGAEMTYDYFFENYSRNSIDNAGFQLNSYVHFDEGYVNAFWDGSRMTYGDGGGGFSPLTSIDIAGHEVSHGLTTFTANLVYADESGALNESFSDIFGTSIERFARPTDWNWLIGEDIGSAFRSMSNPNIFGDPDTYFGSFWAPLGGDDNGGVHSNSGVQNYWYYLLTEGGSGTNDNGDDFTVEALGIDQAGSIAFRNLTVYLTSSSQFSDARFFAIQSAEDLFGSCTFEEEQTANAWYAVGVGDLYNPIALADFATADTFGCALPYTANFINNSQHAITYTWDFGDGATSTEENPTHIYTTAGTYTISLFVDGGDCGTDSVAFVDYITIDPTADCIVILPESGTYNLQNGCAGTIFDSGGPLAAYGAGEDAIVTITPVGAISVNLTFPFFDIEAGSGPTCNFDYVDIFDGSTEFHPLIGRYCNNVLPSDITSTGGSITIAFHSDGGLEKEGFEIAWTCNTAVNIPETEFTSNSELSCGSLVHFLDLSTNSPISWEWDFGDGNTSTDQNPSHTYASEGNYTVTLIAHNFIGENTEIKTDYVTVSFPVIPTAVGETNCPGETATLTGAGTGTLTWFESPTSIAPIGIGNSFTTAPLSTTTTFYVADDLFDSPQFVGPVSNTIGAGGIFNGDQYMIFNNPYPVTLKSVKVYAEDSGVRIFELRSNTGEIIESLSINVPDGESRVILNLDIPAGENLQLGTAVGSAPGLYRNNAGSPVYPYILDESVQISGSSAGPDFYYFFYDWEIQSHTCSSERIPVEAIVSPASNITINETPTLCALTGAYTLSATETGGTWTASCGSCINATTGVFDPTISGEGDFNISYDLPGTCSASNNVTISVVDCLGLNTENKNEIHIYPNPTNGLININTGELAEGTILLKDVLGRTIYTTSFYNTNLSIDLDQLNISGTYFMLFTDQKGQWITTKKVVKQ